MKQETTISERAKMKMDLTINYPISFQQVYDLQRARWTIKRLWESQEEIWLALERCRIYSLMLKKGKDWDAWWEENKLEIMSIKKLKKFYSELQVRECKFCGNPYKKGRIDKKFCTDKCRIYYFQRKKREKVNAS